MNKTTAAAAILATALSTLTGTAALASAGAATAHATTTHSDRAGSYRVTAEVNNTEPMVNKKVKIKATVRPAVPGAQVTLQVKYQDQKAWRTIDRGRLSGAGKVTFKDKVSSVRTRTYRVVKATDSRARGGSGETDKVEVFGWRTLTSLDYVSASYLYPGSSVMINGNAYPDSLAGVSGSTTQPGSVSYNLNRDCKQLDAVYGISDSSAGNGSATLTVTADGVVKHTAPYALTQAQRVVTDVTGVFRLTISDTPIGGIPAVGSPKVLCSF